MNDQAAVEQPAPSPALKRRAEPAFAAFGECMIEITERGGVIRQGFGGDSLNMLLYLARLLPQHRGRFFYLTGLGDDPFSAGMLKTWQQEGLCTDLADQIPGELPGLYYVRTDAAGERQFFYWRDQAAVRRVFTPAFHARALRSLRSAQLFYFTGISLAILSMTGRRRLLSLADKLRKRGAQVVFDSNYRPRLWSSVEEARGAIDDALRHADVALVSFADEQQIHGDPDPGAVCRRLAQAGVREVVVKNGGGPVLVALAGETEEFPLTVRAKPIDTTAAGDAFNAAYLAARLQGQTTRRAVTLGNLVSSQVVQFPGAIIPLEKMPTFEDLS
jgi:2-dehydro-3-deoxygluconokinase